MPGQVPACPVARGGRAVRRARPDVGSVRSLAGSEVVRRTGEAVDAPHLAIKAAHVAAGTLGVIVLEVANAACDGQGVRDHVEIDRRELCQLFVAALDVVEEANGRVRAERRRARPWLDGQEAVVGETGRRAERYRHILIVRHVYDVVFFPVHAHVAADAQLVRRAEAQLLAVVRDPLDFRPGRTRRVAVAGGGVGARVAGALVVEADSAARVVRIVLLLIDVAHQIGTTVDQLEVVDISIDDQRGVFELVLVVRRVERVHRQGRQRLAADRLGERIELGALRPAGHLVEHALGVDVLVRLRQQRVPVVVDLVQAFHADTRVGHRIDCVGDFAVVVDRYAVGRNDTTVIIDGAMVGGRPGEGGWEVVDVAALAVTVDHPPHRQRVVNEREVEHSGDVAIRVSVGGGPIGCFHAALGDIELRLVRDVAQHAGQCATAEQRTLRALENLDALEVGGIDVEVTAGYLPRLLVEINGDRRERAGAAAPLIAPAAGAQASHEDIALPGAVGALAHVGQILDHLVEVHDVQLPKRLRGERLDLDRNVLEVLRPALRGDYDFTERVRGAFRGCACRDGDRSTVHPKDGTNRAG